MFILENLDCHHIKDRGNYYSAGLPDGDNKSSITIYKNEGLVTNVYTRNINGDLISLVEYIKGIYFTQALKWITDICEWDYYGGFETEQISGLLAWLDMIENISSDIEEEPIKPIPESVLNQYINLPHLSLNLSTNVQKEFEIGFSLKDERIIFPIRDENGVLVGAKGRATRPEDEEDSKFIYHYPCPKSKLLYGLYKTYPYIKEKNEVIICEAEKGVLQLWDYGVKNAISVSGKNISKTQIEKIIRLNTNVVIALDKDVTKEHVQKIINELKLYSQISIVWDKEDLLAEKESPMDDKDKWIRLYSRKLVVK